MEKSKSKANDKTPIKITSAKKKMLEKNNASLKVIDEEQLILFKTPRFVTKRKRNEEIGSRDSENDEASMIVTPRRSRRHANLVENLQEDEIINTNLKSNTKRTRKPDDESNDSSVISSSNIKSSEKPKSKSSKRSQKSSFIVEDQENISLNDVETIAELNDKEKEEQQENENQIENLENVPEVHQKRKGKNKKIKLPHNYEMDLEKESETKNTTIEKPTTEIKIANNEIEAIFEEELLEQFNNNSTLNVNKEELNNEIIPIEENVKIQDSETKVLEMNEEEKMDSNYLEVERLVIPERITCNDKEADKDYNMIANDSKSEITQTESFAYMETDKEADKGDNMVANDSKIEITQTESFVYMETDMEAEIIDKSNEVEDNDNREEIIIGKDTIVLENDVTNNFHGKNEDIEIANSENDTKEDIIMGSNENLNEVNQQELKNVETETNSFDKEIKMKSDCINVLENNKMVNVEADEENSPKLDELQKKRSFKTKIQENWNPSPTDTDSLSKFEMNDSKKIDLTFSKSTETLNPRISFVDLTTMTQQTPPKPFVFSANKEDSFELNDSNLIILPDTPESSSISRTLNETFSPEPREILFATNIDSNKDNIQGILIINTKIGEETEINQETKIHKEIEIPKGVNKAKNFIALNKTPQKLNSVKTLPLSSSKVIKKYHENVLTKITPKKIITHYKENLLSLNKINSPGKMPIKSIRKRSLSVTDDMLISKKNNRVTFYSPLNMEITMEDIDDQMKKRGENNKPMAKKTRSLSNAETIADKNATFSNLSIMENTPLKEKVLMHPTSRTKLPDFAAIHRKHFKKMESIGDHVARRADRAKILSGKKEEKSAKNVAPSRIPRADVRCISKKFKSTPDLRNIVDNKNVFNFIRNPNMDDLRNKKSNKVVERKEKYMAQYKSRAQSEPPEKSKILKGVRTNRRFDLQMQFRNMNTD